MVLGGGFVIWFWVGVICGGPIVVGLLVAAMVEVFFLAVVGDGEWMWMWRFLFAVIFFFFFC